MIRILFAIVLLAFGSAWAKTTVIYVNGLANVDPVALHINQAKFLDIIREGNLFWRQDLIFDPFDNIAISEFDSREEAAVQIFISKSAIGAATTNSVVDLSSYTFHLGSAYRVLDSEIGYAKRVYIKTKKLAEKILSATQVGTVIIIGHSQGALYVEAALAYLVRGGPENGYARFPSEKVATLNIASPAFTNGGYEYINVDNDENLYRLSAKSLVVQLGWGNVQKSTTSLCIKPCADGRSEERRVGKECA